MNTRFNWLLAITAAAVFGLIWFVERPLWERAHTPVSRRIFPDFNPARIGEISVFAARQTEVRLQKTNNTWWIVRPIHFRADPGRVETLLNTLSNLQWVARITADELKDRPKAQEEFGFTTAQFSFEVNGDERSDHWSIGARTAPGDQIFLQLTGANDFYLVDARLLEVIPKSRDEWRDRAVLPLAGVGVDQILVTNVSPGGTAGGAVTKGFQLQFDRTNLLWKMTWPQAARVDNAKLNGHLVSLVDAEIAQFTSDEPRTDLEALGLRPPELEISFLRETNVVGGLLVGGSPATNGTLVYVQHTGQPAVFLAPAAALAPWRGAPSDFRERRLVTLPPDGAAEINIRGDESFSLRRQADGTWRVAPPFDFPADPVLVSNLFEHLTGINVEFGKTVVTDLAAYGLTNPTLQYRLFKAAAPPAPARLLAQIDFGTGTNKGAGPIYTRRSDTDETSVDLIKPDEFGRLARASWQLRDRRIWDFAASNVTTVTIRQKGYTENLLRNTQREWIIGPGMQGEVNSVAIEETLHRLGELRAYFWTARGQEPDDRYGFKIADYRIQIEVQRGGRTESLVIDFGSFSDFLHPYAAVTLNGTRMVFEFPLTLYQNLVREHLSIIKALAPAPGK